MDPRVSAESIRDQKKHKRCYMFFLVASIGDVSESNQFLQASTHGTRPH